MLTLELTQDPTIEIELFGDVLQGEKVALCQDGTEIGVCVFNVGDQGVTVKRLSILPQYRGQRIGDFFIRAMIFKLSLAHIDIVMECSDARLQKFGFVPVGDIMVAKNGDVVFPSSCGGKH